MRAFLIMVSLAFFIFQSCDKDGYLKDDGLHRAEVDMSTYDYLASHPHKMFDTLLLIVDHFGLKEEINNAKTFWVPSDYSIMRYFRLKEEIVKSQDENASYTFDDFLGELTPDTLKAYINTDGSYDLTTAEPHYSFISNPSDIEGFAFHKQKQPTGQWSFQDVFHLYFVKVRGEADETAPDGSVRLDRNDIADLRILCQTSGIKSSTGTTINVLSNNHVFWADFGQVLDSGPLVEDIDGGGIRFTYDLSFRVSNAYTGTSVVANSAWIAETFGIQPDEVSSLYGTSILMYAIDSNGSLDNNYTAAAPGHWFDRNGDVVSWGENAILFSEYNTSTITFSIGQYPSRLAVGDQYTIKQALVYTNRNNQKIRAEFIFNITLN